MSRTIFGPAGNSQSFYDEGFKNSFEAPAWIAAKGLSWFEYSCGKGARIRPETSQKIGNAAKEAGIGMSIHAPYYVNFASPDEEKREKSRGYIHQTIDVAHNMGAKRIVFHPGSCSDNSRSQALATAMDELKILIEEVKVNGSDDVILCPETMGRIKQLGDLDEVLTLCELNDAWLPCIDFGHLNARTFGGIKSEDDYMAILDTVEDRLGYERLKKIHIHFSHIEYAKTGEKCHLTLEDTEYGPFFEPLARQLVKRKMEAIVVCESKHVMAEDALQLKAIYESLL